MEPTLGYLTNLFAHYKANSLSLSDNDPVSLLVDSSGNGHTLAQATGGLQPLYKANIFNAIWPAVQFDGIDDYLKTLTVFSLPQPVTVFFVFSWQTVPGPGIQTVFYDGSTTTFYNNALLHNDNGNTGLFLYNGTQLQDFENIHDLKTHYLCNVWDSGNSKMYKQGVLNAQGAQNANVFDGFTVGIRADLNPEVGNFNFAEMIVYAEAMSDTNRITVEDYIREKYITDTSPVLGYTSGLFAHYKADAVTLSDGESLSRLPDQSGNDRDFGVVDAPILKESELSGHAVVRFDGIGNVMITSPLSLPTPYTIFIVERWRSPFSGQEVSIDGGATQQGAFFRSNNNQQIGYNNDDSPGGAFERDIVVDATDSWHWYAIVVDGANSKIYSNGYRDAGFTGSLDALALTGFTIGAAANNSQHADIDVAELIYFAGALSDVNRKTVQEYIGRKYLNDLTDNEDKTVNVNNVINYGYENYITDFPFLDSTDAALGASSKYSHLVALADPSISFTNDFTIETWVKLNSIPGQMEVIARDNDPDRSYSLTIDPTGLLVGLVWKDGGSQSIVIGVTPLTTGVWVHIAFTYHFITDGTSRLRVFINGVQDSEDLTGVGPVHDGTADVWIGARERSGGEDYFDGVIDEVKFYNIERTAADILGDMSDELDGSEANLQLYLPFEELVLPNTPTNITPLNAAVDVSLNPVLIASAFSHPFIATHSFSQWEVATDTGFSDIIFDSGETAVNLISIGVLTMNGTFMGSLTGSTKLNLASVYYWRVRYKDSDGNFSAYSTYTSFTTIVELPESGQALEFLASHTLSIFHFTRSGDNEAYESISTIEGLRAQILPAGTDIAVFYPDVPAAQLWDIFIFDLTTIQNGDKLLDEDGNEYIVKGVSFKVNEIYMTYQRIAAQKIV